MKLFSSKKRVAAIGAAAAITLVGGSVAYGFWTTGGSGSGTAQTGPAANNLVITASGPSGLVPGGAAQDLNLTVENPNTYSVQLTGLDVSITPDSVTCDGVGVPNGWFTLAASQITSTTTVDAGTTGALSTPSGVTLQMNDLPVDQNDCQDAAVAFELTVS